MRTGFFPWRSQGFSTTGISWRDGENGLNAPGLLVLKKVVQAGTGHHKEWKGRWNSQPERRDQDQKMYEQGSRRELGASFSPLQLIFVGDSAHSAHAWSCSNWHDLVTCIHCFLGNLSMSVLVDENIQMFGNLDCKLLWSKVTLLLFWIHLLPVPFIRAGKRACHRRHLTCTEPSRSLIGVESVSPLGHLNSPVFTDSLSFMLPQV